MEEKKRIVVIDDQELIARVVERGLTREGYAVTVFHEPVEAVEGILSEPPDLVITDMQMPGMSGTDVAKRVCHATNVIIMSGGFADTTVIVRALDAIVDRHAAALLAKPIQREVMNQTVEWVLKRPISLSPQMSTPPAPAGPADEGA